LIALKKSSASRVSPLLGLKVFILALIGVSLLGQHFSPLQWTAIVMSVLAAMMLSRTGEKLSLRGALWIFLTCVAYCLSDINIRMLIGHFEYLGLLHGSVLSTCLSYFACGVIAAAMLPFVLRPTTTMVAYSLPFAVSWFGAMLLLFACFGSIGIVYGNIVQSSRGIISIIFGAVLIKYNFEHLDRKVSRGVFFQRLAAAVLMSCAIALYYWGA
jgi:drug/metabolite transporter (DMT)-like permease